MTNHEEERRLLRRRTLGWGLACDPVMPGVDLGRDLFLTSGPRGRDLSQVEGVDNLNQSLAIGLTTLLGSDIFNVDYGFDGLNAIAEETDPILQRERVRIAVITLLHKEPRVRRILDVKLEDGQFEMPVGGSRELNVRVVFETVAGEQGTVSIENVMSHVSRYPD